MITKYRCVLCIETNDPILIGIDENQGGNEYINSDGILIGYWSNFVFVNIPFIPSEILTLSTTKRATPYKIVNSDLQCKSISDFH